MSNTTKRVIAIESANSETKILRYYGYGTVQDAIPNMQPFSTTGITNPCITLDENRGVIWGMQCWWSGDTLKLEETYKDFEWVLVDPPLDTPGIYQPPVSETDLQSTPKNLWWGYKHINGSYQAKRYYDKRDTDEGHESPFCDIVVGPFEATDRNDALEQVKQLTDL